MGRRLSPTTDALVISVPRGVRGRNLVILIARLLTSDTRCHVRQSGKVRIQAVPVPLPVLGPSAFLVVCPHLCDVM